MNILIKNPFSVLLVFGFIVLIVSIMLMITRHNYTKIVRMIDDFERETIAKRIEEWGEMIVNNVQQECMERKLSLTIYILVLPVLSLLIIAFSVYELNWVTNIVIAIIHFVLLLVLIFIIRAFSGKKRKKKDKPVKTKSLIEKEDVKQDDSVIKR